ncbi:uncharacterized protein LOC123654637 [Melitaea cinxia]|uniref:uncharacterized protein LOC123654637 n=1 Tax=Melitaea cinxia TaxID=113334 RepID=UPI001E272A52|nr:uncharacterized protein LOC123654637 [Melitaea cinxia]
MADIKQLKAKRSNIKGRLTKFKTYLDDFSELENITVLDINKLSLKLSRIQTLLNEFDEVQGQLEMCEGCNQAEELDIRDSFEQEFDNYISVAQNFIDSNSAAKEMHSPCKANLSTSQCNQDNNNMLGFKLPVIKIPTFDGTYFKWLEFKETFISLVHANDSVKNIHKYHYLLSYLEGEAARVLCNLEVSDANYSEAWQLLCKRYDNKRQLINNHLKALFSIESVRETDKSLRFIVDHVNKNLRALRTLGLPVEQWDVLVIYMVTAKLDSTTYYKWEETRTTLPEIPTLDHFFEFLKNRANVLETVSRQRQDKPKILPPPAQPRSQTKSFALTTKHTAPSASGPPIECLLCKGAHRLYECTSFRNKTAEERSTIVSKLNLCENCLRSGHRVQRCRLPGSCRSCKQKHNTLLHTLDPTEVPSTGPTQSHTQNLAAIANTNGTNSEVLLCTAQVQLMNPDTNQVLTVRALLDSGSQSTFITEKVQSELNLAPQPTNVSVLGLSDTPLAIQAKRCALHFQSLTDPFKISIVCLVIPKIADKLPKVTLDSSQFDFSQFKLADPRFFEPSSIDMLIGADLFWDLIGSSQHSLGPSKPILRSSKLGWLIAGPLPTLPKIKNNKLNKVTHCNFVMNEVSTSPNIDEELKRFWELENVPQSHPFTKEERRIR